MASDALPAPTPHDEVALAGTDGRRAAELLGKAKDAGSRTLYYLARRAVARLLDSPDPSAAKHLFDDAELIALADQLAATNATANLLGRARIREKADQAERRQQGQAFADEPFRAFAEPPPPLPPKEAIDYFTRLVPSLAVTPERFGPLLRREAFTLAARTDETMLASVKDVISEALTTGDTSNRTAQIESILEKAGVSPASPDYSSMVFRTNMMDAYNVGAQEELRTPDMADAFPVWQYLGILDGRQGADHEPQFDRYYPNTAAFADVRGPRVFNCRCSFRAIDKYEWADLQAAGATVEDSWGSFSESSTPAPVHVTLALPTPKPDPSIGRLAEAFFKFADRPAVVDPGVVALLEAVRALIDRPPVVNVAAPPPAAITVNVPEQPPAVVNVNVPESPPPVVSVSAPVVNVAAAPPPNVTVNVPESLPPVVNVPAVNVPAPIITVNVPEPGPRPPRTATITNPDGTTTTATIEGG